MKKNISKEFYTNGVAPYAKNKLAELYVDNRNGKLIGMAFVGKQSKPIWNYYFKDTDQIMTKWNELNRSLEGRESYKAEKKAKRLETIRSLKAIDVSSYIEKIDSEEKITSPYGSYNGFKGVFYDSGIPLSNIAVIVRKVLAKKFPDYKFSVTTEGYRSIRIVAENNDLSCDSGHDVNIYRIEEDLKLTSDGVKVFSWINRLLTAFNYDDSDVQTDYFSRGFYYTLIVKIGR